MTTQEYRSQSFGLEGLPDDALLNILRKLKPRELANIGYCSKKLYRLTTDDSLGLTVYRKEYLKRWEEIIKPVKHWRELYIWKRTLENVYNRAPIYDTYYGHTANVKCIKIVPELRIAFSGGYDKHICIWDLDTGTYRQRSIPLNGQLRSLAISPTHLAAVVTGWEAGFNDNRIKLWKADHTHPEYFDLSQTPYSYLSGHGSPVVSVDMQGGLLYSGSWDNTCKVWSPGGGSVEASAVDTWSNIDTCKFDDWVWAVQARGSYLFASTSRQVHIHDRGTLQPIHVLKNLHDDAIQIAIEASQDGKLLFSTSVEDGVVVCHDVRMQRRACQFAYSRPGIDAMAFDDPWLAFGDVDGRIQIHRLGTATPQPNGGARLEKSHRDFPPNPARSRISSMDLRDGHLLAGMTNNHVSSLRFGPGGWFMDEARHALEPRVGSYNCDHSKHRELVGWEEGGAQQKETLWVAPSDVAEGQREIDMKHDYEDFLHQCEMEQSILLGEDMGERPLVGSAPSGVDAWVGLLGDVQAAEAGPTWVWGPHHLENQLQDHVHRYPGVGTGWGPDTETAGSAPIPRSSRRRGRGQSAWQHPHNAASGPRNPTGQYNGSYQHPYSASPPDRQSGFLTNGRGGGVGGHRGRGGKANWAGGGRPTGEYRTHNTSDRQASPNRGAWKGKRSPWQTSNPMGGKSPSYATAAAGVLGGHGRSPQTRRPTGSSSPKPPFPSRLGTEHSRGFARPGPPLAHPANSKLAAPGCLTGECSPPPTTGSPNEYGSRASSTCSPLRPLTANIHPTQATPQWGYSPPAGTNLRYIPQLAFNGNDPTRDGFCTPTAVPPQLLRGQAIAPAQPKARPQSQGGQSLGGVGFARGPVKSACPPTRGPQTSSSSSQTRQTRGRNGANSPKRGSSPQCLRTSSPRAGGHHSARACAASPGMREARKPHWATGGRQQHVQSDTWGPAVQGGWEYDFPNPQAKGAHRGKQWQDENVLEFVLQVDDGLSDMGCGSESEWPKPRHPTSRARGRGGRQNHRQAPRQSRNGSFWVASDGFIDAAGHPQSSPAASGKSAGPPGAPQRVEPSADRHDSPPGERQRRLSAAGYGFESELREAVEELDAACPPTRPRVTTARPPPLVTIPWSPRVPDSQRFQPLQGRVRRAPGRATWPQIPSSTTGADKDGGATSPGGVSGMGAGIGDPSGGLALGTGARAWRGCGQEWNAAWGSRKLQGWDAKSQYSDNPEVEVEG